MNTPNALYNETRDKIAAARETQLADAIADRNRLRAALSAASGYLMNAKIDLQTGAPKTTAIRTIEGGLKVVLAALDASPPQ
jgi:hypothetical protein